MDISRRRPALGPWDPARIEIAPGPECTVLYVGQKWAEQLEDSAIDGYDLSLQELSFEEAADLAYDLLMTAFEDEDHAAPGAFYDPATGRIIVDSQADGHQAFMGVVEREADALRPRIDDERELVFNVISSQAKRRWRRKPRPELERTYRYKGERHRYV